MKIIGFGISRILGEKNEVKPTQLNLSQNIEIKSIQKDTMPVNNQEILNLKFLFSIIYSNELGKIEISGNIIILPEDDEIKEFLKSWREKTIPENFKAPIFNLIMTKCNVKAASLEDEIGLPIHIPMPKVAPKE